MSRLLAATLFMVILSSVAFGQHAQTKVDTVATSAKRPNASSSPRKINLADLLTNIRFKFARSAPCPGPEEMAAKAASQLAAALNKEEKAERTGTTEKACPIDGNVPYITVSGVWKSEVTGVSLISPEQVQIDCDAQEKRCRVLRVSFDLDQLGVAIKGPDETDYGIVSWDANGLFATHNPDSLDKCHRSVLTVSFASGDVSLSDIPTHGKGCEVFQDTNSYRLISGNYYVDTTPGNNAPPQY